MLVRPQLVVHAQSASDRGLVRPLNEDVLVHRVPADDMQRLQSGELWVLTDGIGSGETPREAATLAANGLANHYWHSSIPTTTDRLRAAINAANLELFTRYQSERDLGTPIGATALAAVIHQGRLMIAHAGRSRAYLLRNGTLQQLTHDHTWVADRVRRGELDLSAESTHPRRNVITRCLGIRDQLVADVVAVDMLASDIVLLCSDGLHRQVPTDEITAILAGGGNPARALVERSNAHGGRDNTTVVVLQATEQHSEHATTQDRLALLYRSSLELGGTLDIADTMAHVTRLFQEATRCDRTALYLLDAGGNLSVGATRGFDVDTSPSTSSAVIHRALTERRPIMYADAQQTNGFDPSASIVNMSLRTIICLPLLTRDVPIGLLYADSLSPASAEAEADMSSLVAYAAQAATAIEHARLHQQFVERSRDLEEARSRQDRLVRSLSSGLIAMDEHDVITDWNPAVEELTGIPAAIARGARFGDVVPTELRSWFQSLAQQALNSAQTMMHANEWSGALAGRPRVVLACRVARIVDTLGRPDGLVFIINDRTDVVMLEEMQRREREERDQLRGLVRRYLAPSVAEQVLRNPEAMQLGGTRQDVTILFADIRGFTGLSEHRKPEDVVAVLNSYLALATREIFAELGTLDKFLGDGVMAIFGAPVAIEHAELRAVRAALRMRASLDALRRSSGERIGFGIGIHSGHALVGNIGTEQLMNYTAVGDIVNVSARLQAEARSGEILISDTVAERLSSHLMVEELGQIYVKGRAVPIATFKVLGLNQGE